MASAPELPLFVVHASDSGDKVGQPSSSSRESTAPRKEILHRRKERKHTKPAVVVQSSSPSKSDGMDETKKPRVKKSCKPSRRWLSAEIDRLFKQNVELARLVKNKEEVEGSLAEANARLESRLAELKSIDGRAETLVAVKQRNRELSQDVFLMKNLVVRLNMELERSEDRARRLVGDRKPEDNLPHEPRHKSGGKAEWIRRGELTALAPLLEAYDESLREKESLVVDLRQELERLSGRTKQVVEENIQLRTRLHDQESKGEVTYSEWVTVQKEAGVIREQNELLMRQVKLAHSKLQELRAAFQSKLDECSRERDDALEQLAQSRTELFTLKGRFSSVQEELSRIKEQAESRIPQSVHLASINECKRLFEELKSRYESEREGLLKRLGSVESTRPRLESQLVSVTSERDHLLGRIKELEVNSSALNGKLTEISERLELSEKKKEDLRRELAGSVAFSGELVAEHERLLQKLTLKSQEASLSGALANRLDHLKNQLQGVERETAEQMTALDVELRKKAGNIQRVREEEAKEVTRLKELVASQEATIDQLTREKLKKEEELEIVWKAATKVETRDGDNESGGGL